LATLRFSVAPSHSRSITQLTRWSRAPRSPPSQRVKLILWRRKSVIYVLTESMRTALTSWASDGSSSSGVNSAHPCAPVRVIRPARCGDSTGWPPGSGQTNAPVEVRSCVKTSSGGRRPGSEGGTRHYARKCRSRAGVMRSPTRRSGMPPQVDRPLWRYRSTHVDRVLLQVARSVRGSSWSSSSYWSHSVRGATGSGHTDCR
jgi:hypothetical protein